MLTWFKECFFLLRQYIKQKSIESDLKKAQKHALLALAYWKDCKEEADLHFQIENSSTYVRLGK